MDMRIRNLDGEYVEILGSREIRVNDKIIRLKKWYVEKYRKELEKLKECHLEKETDKAILVISENNMLWIPKSVIEEIRGD